jgi:putative oxidoreductase
MERLLGQYSPYLYAVMRIVVGFLFACHGAQKLFGVLGGFGRRWDRTVILDDGIGRCHRALGRTMHYARLADRLCRLHRQRPDGNCLLWHTISSFWPIQNDGELAALYCFVFLYIASVGSGVWSIDWAFGKS